MSDRPYSFAARIWLWCSGVVPRWFTFGWWRYLLAKPADDVWRWQAFWCRLRNHPAGIYWYNPGGLEPDMHCKGCGDNLG